MMSEMWLPFLLLHLTGLVGYNLFLRKSLTQNVDRWSIATAMQTGIALPMLLVPFIVPVDFSVYTSASLLLVGAAILLVIALHLTNVKALQYLEVGTYSVLYNLRIIFTTVLGVVFIGEEIVPLRILGGVLIFFAVFTIKQKGERHLTLRGIRWGLAASVVISILNATEKTLIGDIGYLPYAVPVMLGSAAVMWLVPLVRRVPMDLSIYKQRQIGGLMTLRAMSAYGFTLAFYTGGLLSVSSYISSLSVVAIVILGAVFLKERDHMYRKVAATGIAAMGLTAILISSL